MVNLFVAIIVSDIDKLKRDGRIEETRQKFITSSMPKTFVPVSIILTIQLKRVMELFVLIASVLIAKQLR